MANSRDDKPFVVFIDGSRYWLLIPPGDAGDSRLVKKNCQQLLESCDLLQLANLTPFVDDVVCAIQEYKKQQQIAIGSQCNRVMKHIQESAVYLYQYKDISEATVKNLHLAMKWLFEVRPPRVIGGRELLKAICEVTRSVHATARKIFMRLRNAEKVVSETLDIIATNRDEVCRPSFIGAYIQSFMMTAGMPDDNEFPVVQNEPEDLQNIRLFKEMVSRSLLFWKNLMESLDVLKNFAFEINIMVQQDEKIGDKFDLFKETVLRLSSGWRAIEKVSQQYIKNIKDEELKLLADGMRPIGLLEDFREFARNVDGNFQDLESKLILKQAENMQNKVAIYSTWVQPQLISEVRQCQGIVEEATKYVELGKVREAERKFIQVAQHSNRITTITKVYICRLEELEKYSVYQQEILMKKMEDLENKKKEKNKQIFQRLEEVSRKEQEKRCREAEKAKIKERREEAERNKRRAERRERDAKKWLLIPLIGLIPYLLDDSASDVRREESNIKECDDKIQSLERIIQNVQSEISNLKREVSNLNSEISNLKVESKRRNDTLLEIKQTTADLIQSIYHWTEFTSTVEDGAKKAKTIANFFIKASEKDDSSRILESKGTQTKVTSFQEAFAKAEELLEKQWDNLIVYVYTCEVCKKEKRGLPLPLDKDTVVCGECAHKFIEY
jgi:regulator of replication initiation timing